jgi:hypothetical protein
MSEEEEISWTEKGLKPEISSWIKAIGYEDNKVYMQVDGKTKEWCYYEQ